MPQLTAVHEETIETMRVALVQRYEAIEPSLSYRFQYSPDPLVRAYLPQADLLGDPHAGGYADEEPIPLVDYLPLLVIELRTCLLKLPPMSWLQALRRLGHDANFNLIFGNRFVTTEAVITETVNPLTKSMIADRVCGCALGSLTIGAVCNGHTFEMVTDRDLDTIEVLNHYAANDVAVYARTLLGDRSMLTIEYVAHPLMPGRYYELTAERREAISQAVDATIAELLAEGWEE